MSYVDLFMFDVNLFVSDIDLFMSEVDLFVFDVDLIVSDIDLFISDVDLFKSDDHLYGSVYRAVFHVILIVLACGFLINVLYNCTLINFNNFGGLKGRIKQ